MKVTYTKIEAAKVQLNAAIKMYFEDADPAAIHTLYGASHRVIIDMLSKQQTKSSFDEMLEHVKPGKEKEALKIFNRVRNYLKHADEDGDEAIEFDSELNDISLFLATNDYRQLTGMPTVSMNLFGLWFLSHNPDIFSPPTAELKNVLLKLNSLIKDIDKEFFFTQVPIFAKEKSMSLLHD